MNSRGARHHRPLWGMALLGLSSLLLGSSAEAGPARYNPKTRGFTFTYTFADLPSGQVGTLVGAVPRAKDENADVEDRVRALLGAVSDLLFDITQGRARIERLEYVNTIKEADLVVSLTGTPASPGWAQMAASGGKPGQIALYYQSLLPRIRQEVVFTAAHEIAHYLFGLADEYAYDRFPGGCPVGDNGRPVGPACLMDNYNSGARGYYGRLCGPKDHNRRPSQPLSCQELVDAYFKAQGIEGTGSGDQPFTPNPKKTVVASTIAKVRQEVASKPELASNANGLRDVVSRVFKEILGAFNADTESKVVIPPSEENKAVELITEAATTGTTSKPQNMPQTVFQRLKDEARRLAGVFKSNDSDDTRRRVAGALDEFISVLIKAGELSLGLAPSEQLALAESLAREETKSDELRMLDEFVGRNDVALELDRLTAEWIVTILDELDAPGTANRLDILRKEFDPKLRQFKIPGRNSREFGLRRTRLVTPDPASADGLMAVTQGGVFPYQLIRDQGTIQFAKLLDHGGYRGRIELQRPAFGASANPADFLDPGTSPQAVLDLRKLQAQAEAHNINVLAFLDQVVNDLQANRIENIALLVPQDGLPPEFVQFLDNARARIRKDQMVRLDLVQVGPAPLPSNLRDMCIRSGGSTLIISDLDEIGALAQRLRNEESSGSWIIIPHQGEFTFGGSSGDVSTSTEKLEDLQKWLKTDLTALGAPALQNPGELKGSAAEAAAKVEAATKNFDTSLGGWINALKEEAPKDAQTLPDLATTPLNQLWAALPDSSRRSLELLHRDFLDLRTQRRVIANLIRLDQLCSRAIGPEAGAPAVDPKPPVGRDTPAGQAVARLQDSCRALLSRLSELVLLRSSLGARLGAINNISDPDKRGQAISQLGAGVFAQLEQLPLTSRLIRELQANVTATAGLLELSGAVGDANATDNVARVLLDALTSYTANETAQTRGNSQAPAFGWNFTSLTQLVRIAQRQILEFQKLASGNSGSGRVPIFKRIDRDELKRLRDAADGASRSPAFSALGAGSGSPSVETKIPLARFFAEGDAGIEFVLGLSRPLPAYITQNKKLVRIELYDDSGALADGTARLLTIPPDPGSNVLVYRAEAPDFLRAGWYNAVLAIDANLAKLLRSSDLDPVNYTFSIASDRDNVELIARVVEPDNDPERGTLSRSERVAAVEVQVLAGSPVMGADVVGFYQPITAGSSQIPVRRLSFADDGKVVRPKDEELGLPEIKDREAGDGIYTGAITISDVTEPTEMRVLIQADTTERGQYIQLDNPYRTPSTDTTASNREQQAAADAKKATASIRLDQRAELEAVSITDSTKAEGRALRFERATSLHFHVKP